jgi:Zn-dependent membrane protease YugP
MSHMGIGTSIFLIAVGAILKFAVTATVSGISLATVGIILMVVGILGLLISLVILMQADRRGALVARERVVERDPYVDPRL